jgi:hypothetical protein
VQLPLYLLEKEEEDDEKIYTMCNIPFDLCPYVMLKKNT